MDFQVVVLAGGTSKNLVPLVSKVFPHFLSTFNFSSSLIPHENSRFLKLTKSSRELRFWICFASIENSHFLSRKQIFPLTKQSSTPQEVPKALLPVANRPVLSYVLELLELNNLKDLIVVRFLTFFFFFVYINLNCDQFLFMYLFLLCSDCRWSNDSLRRVS